MQILTPGHRYVAAMFEDTSALVGGDPGLVIQFIEKTPVSPGSTELRTVCNGTTNEEILKILIDRMIYLQGTFPCMENETTIYNLENALYWLNERTAGRKARDVEGKQIA